MNEYACYGKGHTIHSSGQIEWFKNSVDDRSVQVGGKQRICTIDGYTMPLTCRGGLMYFSVLGKPTDKDLERYPAVHLTGPHLSILDDSSSTLTPCLTLMTNQHVIKTYQHDVSHETPDYEKFRPYLVGSMWILFRKQWNSPPNGESPYPIPSL